MVLIIRILTDILWQFKEISLATNIYILFLVLFSIRNVSFRKNQINILLIAFSLIISFIIAFFIKIDDETVKIFIKVCGSLFLFYIGLIDKKLIKYIPTITKLNIGLIILLFVMAILGKGYQQWGSTNTFSGIYFFKTDLSLAVMISYTFILISDKISTKIKILLGIFSFYLIIIANARIHYLTFFLVTLLYIYRNKFFKAKIKELFLIVPVVLCVFIVFITVIYEYLPKGFLTLNLLGDDALSGANLQGRDLIWETLFNVFFSSSFINQLFGLGLDADKVITSHLLGDELTYNSHNSFIYILISAGWLGLFVFSIFTITIFKRFLNMKNLFFYNKKYQTILFLFICNFLIFFIISFSNAAILYQQQTWFFMYFSGALFQEVKTKRKII